MRDRTFGARAFGLVVMLVALLGIAASYVAMNRGFGGALLVARTVNFFSFFTVLSNVLVVLASRAAVFRGGPGSEELFFDRCRTRTAIAVYVFVVGAVYSLVLRSLWHPEGLQRVGDMLLHDVTPPLFLLDWWLFVRKGTLRARDVGPWLVFPALYAVYSLAHGAASDFYPYPFIDVRTLGYLRVLMNMTGFVLVFALVGLVFVTLDRWRGRRA